LLFPLCYKHPIPPFLVPRYACTKQSKPACSQPLSFDDYIILWFWEVVNIFC
jgi:hypothetical protein